MVLIIIALFRNDNCYLIYNNRRAGIKGYYKY
jgi:hypothetical protein